MRYLTIFIIAILVSSITQAQTYEVGLYAGGANFIGDVGSTATIAPNAPVVGAIAKWNRSSRHSFRFSAIYAQLLGDDTQSNESRRQQRGFLIENDIIEVSLGLEYTFWEFDMFKDRNPSTPYLYTGLTLVSHEDLAITSPGNFESLGGGLDFAIPMVLGYKFVVSENLIFALELGARYVLTDTLDGSAPENDPNGTLGFGNINNDDWYVFTGVTLTYSFGRKPCFCAF